MTSDILDIIKNGGVVALRTDTVYGLIARFDSADAVTRVLNIKGRSADKGLPVLCSDMEMVKGIAELPAEIEAELNDIWPARITAILKSKPFVSKLVRGNSENIAVRVPYDDELIKIIKIVGVPIVATSANRSGDPEARSLNDLKDNAILYEVDGCLDGGLVEDNIKPSKIIDFTVSPHLIIRL